MGAVGNSEGDIRGTSRGFAGTGSSRCQRGIHRWQFRPSEKGGAKVGKTKRGKGTKIMAVADSHGLPVSLCIESASPHEVKLVDSTLVEMVIAEAPQNLVGDNAYDSDKLDTELRQYFSWHQSFSYVPKLTMSMAGMLQILTYLLAFYLVVKGLEILQIGLVPPNRMFPA
jgi:hypothetical protein